MAAWPRTRTCCRPSAPASPTWMLPLALWHWPCPRLIWRRCRRWRPAPALALAAQDLSQHEAGAYTGEVSAAMLQDFGVRYALVGHSERRQYHGETDAL